MGVNKLINRTPENMTPGVLHDLLTESNIGAKFRIENKDSWEASLDLAPYVPVTYTNSSIDYQLAYQQEHGGPPIYASDLSLASVRCCQINYARYSCEADVRKGSLFDPWAGEQFDIIVDDVSGIAEEIAVISAWFQGVPCDTGADGLALVSSILQIAPRFLNEGGRFFFPVLSLSDVDLLLSRASESFTTVKQLLRQEWPLPPELKEHLPLLRKLADEGRIQLQERFGMVTCFTEIYCAYNA